MQCGMDKTTSKPGGEHTIKEAETKDAKSF